MPPDAISPARRAAYSYLTEQASRFPELGLHEPETAGMEPRDAALAHAIVDAVIRRWLTIEAVLGNFLKRPMREAPAATQAALLAGAAQMLFLDRVPVHAAIHESVEFVKVRASKTAGLVNAVLRALDRVTLPQRDMETPPPEAERAAIPLGDGRYLRFREPLLSPDAVGRLAEITSTPFPLVRRWAAEFGLETARVLSVHSLVEPPVVLNTAHANAVIEPALVSPHANRGFSVWAGDGGALRTLLARRNDIWVQDAASARAVQVAKSAAGAASPAAAPKLILDLCAGQGTKTRQLAAEFPEAKIIATDTDDRRREVLRRTFEGHPRVRVLPPREVRTQAPGGAAMALLDVPCTNSGVLPRRPEAKYRWTPSQLERLVGIQREVLTTAAKMVTPGGMVVYSTCSIDREENEVQARWAGSQGLRLVSEERTMPAGLPGGQASAYHDASYVAVLRR